MCQLEYVDDFFHYDMNTLSSFLTEDMERVLSLSESFGAGGSVEKEGKVNNNDPHETTPLQTLT